VTAILSYISHKKTLFLLENPAQNHNQVKLFQTKQTLLRLLVPIGWGYGKILELLIGKLYPSN
jgi:hypothetical protein